MKKITKKISNNGKSLIFLIILIFSVYLWHLYKPGFYLSHDGEPQVVRISAFYKTIMDGQIPPRWAGSLNYGFGTPALSFFFPLEGYLGTIIHLLGFSMQNSYKILMGLSFILAPLFFYKWIGEFFERRLAFIGALFYGLSPYHFLNMYVRGQLGEILAFVFVPLVFWMIERNNKKPDFQNVVLGGIFYTFLILSHNILSLMFSFVFVFYILIRNFSKKGNLISNIALLFSGLLVGAFFWLPALFEARYINSKVFVGRMFDEHFLSLNNLIYSNWGFGSDINRAGGLSSQLGPLHFSVAVLIIIGLFLIKDIKDRRIILFWLFIAIFSIFMSLSSSSFIWNKFHTLQQFQFPWRFTAVSSFAVAVLATYTVSLVIKDNRVRIFIVILLLFFSMTMVRVKGHTDKNDAYYLSYPGTAAYHSEATTIWVAGDASSFPKSSIETISGKANISDLVKQSHKHIFNIDVKTENARILDNTNYFPGWKVFVDGEKVPVEFQDINHRGLITFNVPEGLHEIEVKFTESPIRLFANSVSLLGLALIVILLILTKRLNKIIRSL